MNTHNMLGFLKLHQPERTAKKKKENDFQIGNSNFANMANRSFIHKKVSDEGERKSNFFPIFSARNRDFYGFLRMILAAMNN